ncbi:hypothetical protein MMC10_003518 [Thelotrema lepadinum]|nr:hypothetical protein [Thelotrema lepadinum]
MRLLKAVGFELVDFAPDAIPKHAILSHTWGEGEVLFADIQDLSFKRKKAYNKVQRACVQAQRDGFEYIWIDTCCIDKSSSADLSEAINSMYKWYEDADVCYAYLSDVHTTTDVDIGPARWFTRGWTLQELLAPTNLIFFASDWTKIGEKTTLTKSLSKITTIDEDILAGLKPFDTVSVARRMSWAAPRKWTRPEDTAYGLMGLFSVAMPMLYGEGGERAFLRLQEEIMKQSDDQSIFAWFDDEASEDSYHGLLAKSPHKFIRSGQFIPYRGWEPRPPYLMTNRGLQIDMFLSSGAGNLFVGCLNCPVPSKYEDSTFVGLYLKKIAESDNQYARVNVGLMKEMNPLIMIPLTKMQRIYVPQSFPTQRPEGLYPPRMFLLRKNLIPVGEIYPVVNILSLGGNKKYRAPENTDTSFQKWIGYGRTTSFIVPSEGLKLAVALVLKRNDGEWLAILLGSIDGTRIGFDAVVPPEVHSDVDLWNMLRTNFQPKELGSTIVLQHHHVCITFEYRILDRCKWFLIDMKIELLRMEPKSATMLRGATAPGKFSSDTEKEESKAVQSKRHWWKGRAKGSIHQEE